MKETDLSSFPKTLNAGAGKVKLLLWYFANALVLNSYFLPISIVKCWLLRLFGARIGKSVVIKPRVNIKFPWKLSIGDNTWIGEGVWIDNLDQVTIGKNCCLSQGSIIITGNHNYKKTTFDLITKPIVLEDGVWLGAGSMVCPGVIAQNHALLTMGSVATHGMLAYTVYKGNPAVEYKKRIIE